MGPLALRRRHRRSEPEADCEEEICERQRNDVKIEAFTDRRKLAAKTLIFRLHRLRSGDVRSPALGPKPVTDASDRAVRIVSVVSYVLSGDIGYVGLKSESIAIEDQQALSSLATAIRAASKVESELEWHVETWESTRSIKLGTGEVVNGVPAACDHLNDLVKPHVTRIEP